MSNILKDLRENHNLMGLKAEFEDEGVSLDELLWLLSVADDNELGLTVKIGGCAAIRDLKEIRDIGVSKVVAPMIESEYALRKFIISTNSILGKNHGMELGINVETQTCLKALGDIFKNPVTQRLSFMTIGRGDLAASYNPITPQKLMSGISSAAKQISDNGLQCFIGGRITPNSSNFIRQLGDSIYGFETRKCIFRASPQSLTNETIIKALRFEVEWASMVGDKARVAELKKRMDM